MVKGAERRQTQVKRQEENSEVPARARVSKTRDKAIEGGRFSGRVVLVDGFNRDGRWDHSNI